MKRKIGFLFLVSALSALATLSGCRRDDGTLRFTISGTLDNAAGKTLYIEEVTPDNGPRFVDSIVCDRNGHFQLKGSMAYQTFFNLHASLYDYVVLLPSAGETVTIAGNADDLGGSYRIEGSPESQLMWQIQNYINSANVAVAEIARQDISNKESLSKADYEKAHKVTDSLFLAERQTIYLMFSNFIEDNIGSLSTLYAIDAPFNRTMRVFYSEPDFEMFETVLDGLNESLPDNPHTQYYRTRVERARSERLLSQQADQEIVVEQ